MDQHKQKLEKAKADLMVLVSSSKDGFISLKPKKTSHFFRQRNKTKKLDLLSFTDVISISKENLTVDVEGMVSFKKLSDETLKSSLIPLAVPELRSITVGGTISGLGIESTSYRHGLVPQAALEYEVLTGEGEVVTCSKNMNSELFYSLPNSLATLGYVTKATLKLQKAKKHVKLNLLHFDSVKSFTSELKKICEEQTGDFLDGVIFSPSNCVLIQGEMIDQLPEGKRLNNFHTDIYWKYLRNSNNKEAFLTISDYLWRWDTDVFWCLSDLGWMSRVFENKLFRQSLGRLVLRSDLLNQIKRFKDKWEHKLGVGTRRRKEFVLQDLCLDLEVFEEFTSWYEKEVGIYPIWVCPFKNIDHEKYPLNNFKGEFMLDIGIYTGKQRPPRTEKFYYNLLLEKIAMKLEGHKGLYSRSFFSEEEFWSMYDKKKYTKIKKKYDPNNVFPDIYQKAVGETTL